MSENVLDTQLGSSEPDLTTEVDRQWSTVQFGKYKHFQFALPELLFLQE